MWSPTKVTTPFGSYEFPLKEGTYNYPNSAAFHIEATAVRNYLKSGIPSSVSGMSELCLTITNWNEVLVNVSIFERSQTIHTFSENKSFLRALPQDLGCTDHVC